MGLLSIIIPNYNKGYIIEKTLHTIFTYPDPDLEVIVVDDGSIDNSLETIRKFPCELVPLPNHSGASKARNIGALHSRGEFLFFIDADCLLMPDTLFYVRRAIDKYYNDRVIIGGTYTETPFDSSFFSTFQSIFVSYSELKNREPDYIATHAMIIRRIDFLKSGGFREDFLPILEDVEFSHRMKRQGYRLIMEPSIRVQHFFNFNLLRSLRNAFNKSCYWTVYSIRKGDLFADSGTASRELKINGALLIMNILIGISFLYTKKMILLFMILLLLCINLWISRRLIMAFFKKGYPFGIKALLYYLSLYPLAVIIGAIKGLFIYFKDGKVPVRMRK